MLFNGAVSLVEVIYRRMRWEDYHVQSVGKNMEGSSVHLEGLNKVTETHSPDSR